MKPLHLLTSLLFCSFILTIACNDQADSSPENKTLKDSLETVKVLETISQLPEVADRKKTIEGNSEGGRKLSVWVAEKPGNHSYYNVAVGEQAGNTRKSMHFTFRVYPDAMRVVIYDELNQREIPLEEWRESNK